MSSSTSSSYPATGYSTGYISVALSNSLTTVDNQAVAMQSYAQTPQAPPESVSILNPLHFEVSTGRIIANVVV